MSRLTLLALPRLATPAIADEGLLHHRLWVEFGWLTAALSGSAIGGGAVHAQLRRRK